MADGVGGGRLMGDWKSIIVCLMAGELTGVMKKEAGAGFDVGTVGLTDGAKDSLLGS